jgi:outer membrane lipoprotein-sorting protein
MKKHMLLRFLHLLTVVLFISPAAIAQPEGYKSIANIAAFKQKLNEVSKSTTTIQSDFTQEKFLTVLSDKIESSGKFYFKKENQLRWEYTSPFKYIIILNNDKIAIQDDNKTKQYDIGSNKAFREINNIMTGAVQGKLLQDESKYKAAFYENQKYFLVVLTPADKNIKEMINSIYLYFDKKNYAVTSLKIIESSNDYTLIRFSNRTQNTNISADKFKIK